MDEGFHTLAGRGEAETRVRASRFLALAFPARDEGEARRVLEERERRYFDATHHCAAWRFRDGSWRALDAGEPSGSAGAPILAAIDAQGLVDTAVVVTRYFGGTKLGVGGLVRAYGEAAAEAIAAAPRLLGIPAYRVRIDYPYALTSAVMRVIERSDARDVEHGYATTGGGATVELTLPRARLDRFRDLLRDQSGGQLEPDLRGETVLYTAPDG